MSSNTLERTALKRAKLVYEILSVQDFRVGMLRRNVEVQLLDHASSRDQLMKITQTIWKEHLRDDNELTTVFYLPGMNTRSAAYAFGRCMKGKGSYLTLMKYNLLGGVMDLYSHDCHQSWSSESSSLSELRVAVDRAFSKLFERDRILLENDLHERTIAHWFAVYLDDEIQCSFPGKAYNVDCEYNRDITRNDEWMKRAFILRNNMSPEFRKVSRNQALDYFAERSVYPDIVVHKRGSNANNLLVMEIKKSSSNLSRQFDIQKLKAYTRNEFKEDVLKYKYGVLVEIGVCDKSSERPKTFWFSEGKNMD